MKPSSKAGFIYKLVTREDALEAYFNGEDVYMANTKSEELSHISDLSVDELQADLGDSCYFIKGEE